MSLRRISLENFLPAMQRRRQSLKCCHGSPWRHEKGETIIDYFTDYLPLSSPKTMVLVLYYFVNGTERSFVWRSNATGKCSLQLVEGVIHLVLTDEGWKCSGRSVRHAYKGEGG